MKLPHPTFNARQARWAVGIVLIAGVLLAVRAFVNPARAADPAARAASAAGAPVQVTTAAVQPRTVPIYRSGLGTVTATASVTVKARIDGQLDRVGFTEGQDVRAGQMLAQLDPRTLAAQLAQAEAQQARDAATLANARTDLQRYTTLIKEDAATQQQLDTQRALVAQLEAAVKTDQAQVAYARVQLSFTTISAPMAGRVGARLVDPGNIVHAADAGGIVVINQIDPISVVFTLPEETVTEINRAQAASHQPLEVEALTRAGDAVLGKGRLVLVNNQIDTSSGTVQLKARFANPQHTLWPGQFVNVRLVLGQRDGALTVPDSAVQRSQEGTYAYVIDAEKKAKNQPIRVAQIQDGIAVVDQGLKAGDRVVVSGQYKLKPGSTVVESTARGGRTVATASAPAEVTR